MVRGYNTAETKTTAHLKNMRGRYIVLYVTEGRLHEPDHRDLVDALRQNWPDAWHLGAVSASHSHSVGGHEH